MKAVGYTALFVSVVVLIVGGVFVVKAKVGMTTDEKPLVFTDKENATLFSATIQCLISLPELKSYYKYTYFEHKNSQPISTCFQSFLLELGKAKDKIGIEELRTAFDRNQHKITLDIDGVHAMSRVKDWLTALNKEGEPVYSSDPRFLNRNLEFELNHKFTCEKCQKVSDRNTREDIFLTMDIKPDHRIEYCPGTYDDYAVKIKKDVYYAGETLEKYKHLETCKVNENKNVTVEIRPIKAPNILIYVLKRYSCEYRKPIKHDKEMSFKEFFDFKVFNQYSTGDDWYRQFNSVKYEVMAMIFVHKTANGTHRYTCTCKRDGKWYNFVVDKLKPTSFPKPSRDSYMIFARRTNRINY